jgi:hypothetical protein
MHAEVVQLIANALADSTIGVEAVLDVVPRGDERRPPACQVYDEMRDGWVTRLELEEKPPESVTLPGLIVVLGGPIGWKYPRGRPSRHTESQEYTEVTVGIHSIAHDDDTAEGARDVAKRLQAVRGSLNTLAQPNSHTLRTMNGVSLERLVEVQYAKLFTPIDDVIIAGAVLTTWTVREVLPLYMP